MGQIAQAIQAVPRLLEEADKHLPVVRARLTAGGAAQALRPHAAAQNPLPAPDQCQPWKHAGDAAAPGCRRPDRGKQLLLVIRFPSGAVTLSTRMAESSRRRRAAVRRRPAQHPRGRELKTCATAAGSPHRARHRRRPAAEHLPGRDRVDPHRRRTARQRDCQLGAVGGDRDPGGVLPRRIGTWLSRPGVLPPGSMRSRYHTVVPPPGPPRRSPMAMESCHRRPHRNPSRNTRCGFTGTAHLLAGGGVAHDQVRPARLHPGDFFFFFFFFFLATAATATAAAIGASFDLHRRFRPWLPGRAAPPGRRRLTRRAP